MLGFYARRRNFTNKEVNKGITSILLNITLPFLIINSFLVKYSSELLINAGKVFIYSVLSLVILLIVGKIIYFKVPHERQSVLRFVTTFSNCGFMGFPVMMSLYGNIGVFYGAVFNVAFNIFQYTFGIMIYTKKSDWSSIKKLATNPVIISLAIGFIIFIFSIPIAPPIASAFKMVGDMTTPLAMLLNGSLLAEMEIKKAFSGWTIYALIFVRLIAAPILILLTLKLIGADDLILKVLVVAHAMPAAGTTAVVAQQYGGDGPFASKSIFMTTVFSIITIPLIIMLL